MKEGGGGVDCFRSVLGAVVVGGLVLVFLRRRRYRKDVELNVGE